MFEASRRLRGLALVAATVSSSVCWADPYAVTLDPVEVTSTRSPMEASNALLSTTVITREDIDASQLIDLVSILRQVGGVEIAQSGGMGSQSSLFLRGANSDQTLFMIDGVKINSVESGGAFLQHIMLSEVDHIEVVARQRVGAVRLAGGGWCDSDLHAQHCRVRCEDRPGGRRSHGGWRFDPQHFGPCLRRCRPK